MFKIKQFSFKEEYFEEMIVIDSNSEIQLFPPYVINSYFLCQI